MTGSPLKVLQVVQRYYPELGGLETHVAEVTSRLATLPDLEITVLTTDRTGELPRADRINGVRVIRRRSWPREKDYYLSPGLVRVIRQGGWDLVHVQGSQTFVPLVAMLAARSAGIPYVLTFHSGGYSTVGRSLMGKVQGRILRPLLARADRLIAVSRFEKKRFAAEQQLDPDHFVVINNGGALPPVPSGVTPVAGTIVSSGRLEKYKGHHRAIEALPLVRASVPEATLAILGGGPYEAELRALADRLGVAEHVTIEHLPPTQRGRMAEILAGSRVMAALSSYEAHPVGIMEALTLGLPVLGCDAAGIGDLVEDGLVRGIAVDAEPAAVAAALVEMLRDPATGAGRSAPDFELPTWETCTAALADVYREVAAAHGTAPAAPGPDADATPLRVAQVIATLTTGGAERQLESLVAHSRHDHHTFAVYGGGTVGEAMTAAGADVRVLGMAGLRKLTAIPRLALQLRRLRPDVVHVHLLTGQLWGIPAARLAGVRTIVSTEHSLMETTIENRPLTPTLGRIYRTLERMTTRTVAVSTTTRARLIRWGVPADRISVIDNGIDFAALTFDEVARAGRRRELGVAPGTALIGAVGRLEPVKRFPELLDALAPTLVRGERELLLVGGGPLLDGLRAQAAAAGVADCVHLTGPRPDVPALLSAMDVMVSPSRDETFGMAVLEGLGAGLPVVYAQCPALDELSETVPWAYALADAVPAAADSAAAVQDTAVPAAADPAADEADRIRTSVDRALAERPHGRRPVPAAVSTAYGIGRTAGAVDRLYGELAGAATRRRGPSR